MRVSDNGRYLLDNENQPFFYLADTAWKLFYELNREDADEYLKNRREKGFTVIMPCILAECGKNNKERFYNYNGHEPLVDLDPTRPNEVFFEHVDYIIDQANQLGMTVALLPTWGEFVGPLAWGKGPVIFNEENAHIYGEYLGNRYGGNYVIWVLGGDRDPNQEIYRKVWRAMAEGLKTGDKGRNLITYHPTALHSSSEWLHQESWLDFNMIQTGVRFDHDNYNMMFRDYDKTPVKPVVDGEARYENSHEFFFENPPVGRHVTAHQVRKAAYNSVLSGAMGHTYGCRDVWSYYVPSDAAPTRDVCLHWETAMDLPGAFQMGYLKKLMLDYPFYKLVPDRKRKLVVHGSEEGATYVPAAISENGDFALVYIPENQSVYIDLSIFEEKRIAALWFNPRKGTYTQDSYHYNTNTFARFAPPCDDKEPDYVLVLRVEEA